MSDQSDPFASTTVVDEDPFAEPTPDPAPEPDQAPAEAPPIVDREGQPAEPTAPAPEPPAAPPAAPPAPAPQPEAVQEAPQAPAPPPEAPAQPPEPPAPPAPQEAPSAPESALTPGAPGQSTEDAPDAPEGTGEGRGPRGGKATMRYYKVLLQTGPDQFTLVKLAEDGGKAKEHVVTVKGELYLEARNNEHAYKLAYHLVGRPENGARVWPVPMASFRPRMVKPKPPEPERERLTIS